MATPSTPQLPDVAKTGEIINASNSDWRAILIAIMFLFIAFCVFVVWREILSWKMAKSLDKVSEALISLRLVIVEAVAEGRANRRIDDARQTGRKS
jgi:membrane protein implicated in regulation of membrane protease activity